jgi:pimeloyl-ACP methyl ester carboxylesterase
MRGASDGIVFFPGMGADSSLAAAHRDLGCATRWVEWSSPQGCRTLHEYARRLARDHELARGGFLAGISFGGLVALALAAELEARGVILIGSLRCSGQIAPELRLAALALPLLPARLLAPELAPALLVRRYFGIRTAAQLELLVQMGGKIRGGFLKQLCRLALSVPEPIAAPCPVYTIHGTEDRIVPYRCVRADWPIHGGGHLLSLTHAEPVNEGIRSFLAIHGA